MTTLTHPSRLCWDIFCRVIDNFGDIGVCWRLAVNLALRQQTVRLWVDDASALAWMAPEGMDNVTVLPWTTPMVALSLAPGDVLVEAFACRIDPEYIAAYADCIRARNTKCLWINLEYLSAESYAQRCHGLPSPVMCGPGQGLTKHFFYPGFTPGTGGLLREPELLQRQRAFDRNAWLNRLITSAHAVPGAEPHATAHPHGQRLVSLFCYEPAGLSHWLDVLAADSVPTLLLVTAGRASAAIKQAVHHKNASQPLWNKRCTLSFLFLSWLSQTEYDQLLWACDLNFVRGEDSLVRALWAGKPLVWQIYPQDDGAHQAKLDAFLAMLQAPASMRRCHQEWNGLPTRMPTRHDDANDLQDTLADWQQSVQQSRQALLRHDDLVTALLGFVSKTN
ncbi:MAG: elongation factor P maturation arginine rhamnosyltransferase EarP [Comamonadaceae bacterium]|nr:elongation factor P maturation arginine rhamnosyltransferase EarP [Comamonadaceae bacterium]